MRQKPYSYLGWRSREESNLIRLSRTHRFPGGPQSTPRSGYILECTTPFLLAIWPSDFLIKLTSFTSDIFAFRFTSLTNTFVFHITSKWRRAVDSNHKPSRAPTVFETGPTPCRVHPPYIDTLVRFSYLKVEVPVGVEPTNAGFADPSPADEDRNLY